MKRFILRLDDACPEMNVKKWEEFELLLDKYHIKPIVGVIPDNKDATFNSEPFADFWNLTRQWKDKGWVIAQHGLHHTLEPITNGKTFNLAVENYSEFVGKSLNTQKEMILEGYDILCQHGCKPQCFFALAHTFDVNTVNAINELNLFEFVSDGYDYKPYIKNNVIFVPSIFDSPHSLFGLQTFIEHPSNITPQRLNQWVAFLEKNSNLFIDPALVVACEENNICNQSVYGKIAELLMFIFRKIRT